MSTKIKVGRPKKYNGNTKIYSHRVPEAKYNQIKNIVDKNIQQILNDTYFVDKKHNDPILKILAEGIVEFNKIMIHNKNNIDIPKGVILDKLKEAIKQCKTI